MTTCRACGDGIEHRSSREIRLRATGDTLAEGEMAYCLGCANELFRDRISTRPARLHSAGRGSPLEDGSPGQDNAIRDLEEA